MLVLTKSNKNRLAAEVACPFCYTEPETLNHIFVACIFSKIVWAFVANLFSRISSFKLNFDAETLIQLSIPRQLYLFDTQLSLLITLTRHLLWKTRNQIVHENKTTTPRKVIQGIQRSIKYGH